MKARTKALTNKQLRYLLEKHYAIEIHIIEEYSVCVLVKASNAKKAKEVLAGLLRRLRH